MGELGIENRALEIGNWAKSPIQKNDKYILNYIIKKINKIIKKFVNLYFIFYNHQIHLKLINNFNYF